MGVPLEFQIITKFTRKVFLLELKLSCNHSTQLTILHIKSRDLSTYNDNKLAGKLRIFFENQVSKYYGILDSF